MEGRCHPAFMIDGSVAKDFEILRRMPFRSFRVVERVGEADAIHWFLWHAVHLCGGGYAGDFQYCRNDVVHMAELAAHASLSLYPGRPAEHHGIARSPKMGRDRLGPLEGGV